MSKAKKIIHVVENLDKGAVENWLVRMFLKSREIDPETEWTFYCILGRPGRLDEQVRHAGGIIVYAPVTISNKWTFLKHLRQTLQQGKYDIIHSHHDYLSGFYLLASWGLRFQKRILHIHNTDKAIPVGSAFLQQKLIKPFRRLAYFFSDLIVGISVDTLQEFIDHTPPKRVKTTVLYYGISLKEFEQTCDKNTKRREMGLSETNTYLLFVGRMNDIKNPVFVVDILAGLRQQIPNAEALFIGKGDEEIRVVERAKQCHLENHIHMLGWRDDIPQMMQLSDVFVFPRLEYPKEGLGLVVVEAQAAGLPMVLSHGIVEDAIVIPQITRFVGYDGNPKPWVDAIVDLLSTPNKPDPKTCLNEVQQSRFEWKIATENLLKLYE